MTTFIFTIAATTALISVIATEVYLNCARYRNTAFKIAVVSGAVAALGLLAYNLLTA